MRGAQVLQNGGVGRVAGLGPLALRQVQFEEEDLFELFWAAEVELVPDIGVDLRLEPGDLGRELFRQQAERAAVEHHPGRLHPGENRDERQFDLPEEPVEALLGEAAFERLPDGQRGERLEARACGSVERGRIRQDEVELLRDHVGDGLASERSIEDVGRDLRVERDRGGRCVRVVGDAADEQRLDLVPDDGDAQPIEEASERRRILGSPGGDRPSVGARECECQRRSPARSWVVEQQPDADRRLDREPRLERNDPIARVDLDPRRVVDRGGERGRQVPKSRRVGAGHVRRLRSSGNVDLRRWSGHRVEIERELEPAAIGRRPVRARRPPAARSGRARDARRGHGSVRGDTTECLGRVAGGLAGHRRKALDQRAELILAEQSDDRLAVVVAQTGGLQVELDRKVADDRRQVLAHQHRLAVLDEFVAQLVRLDLVDPLVQRLERPELADELRRGLLPHPGYARDIVRRVALERLVVDHLVRHEIEPLGDPGRIVEDRVLDAGSRRHEPRVVGDELEHVEVAGHDRRVEAAPFRVHSDGPDDVIGLVASQLIDGDAQGFDHLADLRELVAQVVRHALPRRLVLGVLLVPEGRALEIEGDRDVVRTDVGDAAQHDAAEAKDRVDELALRRRQGREREISAVDEPVAVEQHQAFHRQASGFTTGSGTVDQCTRGPPYCLVSDR